MVGTTATQRDDSWLRDTVEPGPWEVRAVEATGASVDGDAAVELAIPRDRLFAEETPLSLSVSDASTGRVGVDIGGTFSVFPPEADLAVSEAAATFEDGALVLSLDVSMPGATPDGDAEEGTDHPAFPRQDDLPPYEDDEYLGAIYDHCDTFAEMASVIDLDVTAETVRRYMIDAGVHEATSYATDEGDESDAAVDASDDVVEDADDPSEETLTVLSAHECGSQPGQPESGEVLLTDGVGLPAGVSVERVVDAVRDSRTLFEVQQRMGVDRECARTMLEHLDLLELVVGRVSAEEAQQVTREEIADRIRANV